MAVAFTRSQQPGTEEATLFYENERDVDTLSIKDDGVRTTEQRNRALFSWESRSLVRRRILQVVIGVLGITIIVFIILAFQLGSSDDDFSYIGTARFKLKDKKIDFKNGADEFVLHAEIGKLLSTDLEERHTKSKSRFKYVNSDGVTLILTQEAKSILSVNWTSSSKQPSVFKDCFYLSKKMTHWYGGSELLFQKWPMENMQVKMGQYVPQSFQNSPNESAQTFGPVLERYWLSSEGVAIIVNSSVPLHVSINATPDAGKLCIKSDLKGYLQPAVSYLGYKILSGHNPRDLHLTVINNFLGKPSAIPNKTLIKKPLWTMSNDSENASQNDIGSFIDEISPCGYVAIDSRYDRTNLIYHDKIKDLRSKGCQISQIVHPYISIKNSTAFSMAAKAGHLVRDCGGKVPGLMKWDNSLAACIDFTRNSSKEWFKRYLLSTGYDSFEFHGGHVNHLPSCYQFYSKSMDPGHLSSEYAKFAVSMNGLNVHVGHRTQKLPIFVAMSEKMSTWKALQTLIPTMLTYSIMGYPYTLPSVVGGKHGNVSDELYIRWMQVNVFLPAVQLKFNNSLSEQLKNNIKTLLKLRSSLLPVILDAFENVTSTGAPIIRPLWWVAPKDPVALRINSQFMVGDTFLVAPILESNKKVHRVYLPMGHWKEQFDEKKVRGNKEQGQWREYNVTLESVVYFKCLALYG